MSQALQSLSLITLLVMFTAPQEAIAQVRLLNRQDTAQPRRSPGTISLKNLQKRVDAAWGLPSAEVRELFKEPILVQDGCTTQKLSSCGVQILAGVQSSGRFSNVRLNFDYDRLTSVVIQIAGQRSSSHFVDWKSQLQAAYGPGRAKYSSPEGLGVTHLEWRLAKTTLDLNYLAGFGGSTELLYYPTPGSSP